MRTNRPGDWSLPPDDLIRWQGCRAYFVSHEGNHGDRLIELGTEIVFERLQIQLCAEPADAEVIFLGGGGALAEGFYRHAYDNLVHWATAYADIPIVVLPSSVYPPSGAQTYLSELADRTAPVFLFTRERQSFERLQALQLPECLQLHLDHDMAFYLFESAILDSWQSRSAPKVDLLIVERFDLEQSSPGPWLVGWATRHASSIGRKWLRRIIRAANKGTLRRGAFYKEALAFYCSHSGGRSPRKIKYKDISHCRYGSFDDFIDQIVQADCIVTTRLHVAILGALLGKTVALQDRPGDYNKIRPVYEHSLQSFPKVNLLKGMSRQAVREITVQARERFNILDKASKRKKELN